MEAALLHYQNAQDYLSLVRVHCYLGDTQKVPAVSPTLRLA